LFEVASDPLALDPRGFSIRYRFESHDFGKRIRGDAAESIRWRAALERHGLNPRVKRAKLWSMAFGQSAAGSDTSWAGISSVGNF
jgi:hypothetical protein